MHVDIVLFCCNCNELQAKYLVLDFDVQKSWRIP